MHTYWVNEGVKGKRHPSLIVSSFTGGTEMYSKRQLIPLIEGSSDFVSSEFETPEMARQPTPFGAAGENP
jgi:hypothetical protein